MHDSRRLMVFFGCVIAQVSEKNKIEEMRMKTCEALNRRGDVRSISSLFKKLPSYIDFNPIFCRIRIPFSLQKRSYARGGTKQAEVEDFELIYDGRLLMIVAWSPLDQRPWGVYDARDRFIEILKTVCELKVVAPCLTHEAIVFTEDQDSIPEETRDVYLRKDSSRRYPDLRGLYLRLFLSMANFYDSCEYKTKISLFKTEFQKRESELLANLKDFIGSKWVKILKKRSFIRQMKLVTIEILEELPKYTSLTQEHDACLQKISAHMANDSLFRNFIEKVNLNDYTKPEIIDPISLMRTIEHTRSEIQAYSTNTTRIVSALIGAITGSILTLVSSYMLGLISIA